MEKMTFKTSRGAWEGGWQLRALTVSQNPCDGTQLPVTPVSGDLTLASGFHKLLHVPIESCRPTHISVNFKNQINL